MDYTLNEKEDYREFINRALSGKIDQDKLQLFTFLLEIIVTEIGVATYFISLSENTEEVAISIVHHGNAIKKNIIDIIYDQVDYLHYRHYSKDSHTLKIRKMIGANPTVITAG